MSLGVPPLPPSEFNPDPKTAGFPPFLSEDESTLRLAIRVSDSAPLPPDQFNPDPTPTPPKPEPFFRVEFGIKPPFGHEPLDQRMALPRQNVRSKEIVSTQTQRKPDRYGRGPLPPGLQLPRENAIANEHIETHFENPHYPLAARQLGYPANAVPMTKRWRIGFTPWRRYTSGDTETPYESPTPALWHPYKQSVLKGDAPIIGQDIFLNLIAGTQTEFEGRRLPVPSGVSAARVGSAEFYGQSEQLSVQNNLSFTADLFKGETVFQPVHWMLRVQPVFNINYLDVKEAGIVNPDPRGSDFRDNSPPPDNSFVVNPGDIDAILNPPVSPPVTGAPANFAGDHHTTRTRDHIALQEAFGELHQGDLSVNYDFIAVKAGIQIFNSDFRGFIFNESNLGARLFGNAANNLWQYNLAVFELMEKDTFSELNRFSMRDQRVIVANLYRQDFLRKGYTAQWSFHASLDDGGIHYDRNGNIARPAPIGTVVEHDVRAYYLGWTGDGHIGRLNLSHAFYQAFGRDEFNGLAGRPTSINAQMAALELSYDRDWVRYKASVFYASGDDDADDGTAGGFDTIVDNANFTGGPFSYFVRQGFNLGGTAVLLKTRNSLFPNLRTSKTEGQANFVNPGVLLLGVGAELELTPKLRSFLNANYIRFSHTDSLQTALQTARIDPELGIDLSIGFQYRPLLTDNVIISTGFGALIPGRGFKDIYRRNTLPVDGFGPGQTGQADAFLYSGLFAVTFTY